LRERPRTIPKMAAMAVKRRGWNLSSSFGNLGQLGHVGQLAQLACPILGQFHIFLIVFMHKMMSLIAPYFFLLTTALVSTINCKDNTENSKQIFPEKELCGLSPNFLHMFL
jgi:hypothetical protein